MLKIYSKRFSTARGWHWRYERDCDSTNQSRWLEVFEEDEPEVEFVVSNKDLTKKKI